MRYVQQRCKIKFHVQTRLVDSQIIHALYIRLNLSVTSESYSLLMRNAQAGIRSLYIMRRRSFDNYNLRQTS